MSVIPVWTRPFPSISVDRDCQAAVPRGKNKTYNVKNRNIRLRHKLVRQLTENGVVTLDFVKSQKNLADMKD